jgi:ribonuclease P protein component
MPTLPAGSLLVIRALTQQGDTNIESEISGLIEKLRNKVSKAVTQ